MKIIVKTSFDLDKIDIQEVTRIWLYNATQEITRQARINAPYETGTLKKSIWVEPGSITRWTTNARVGPRKVIYAVRREYENKKNPHKKFYMKRTADSSQPIVQEAFETAVKIVISKI